MVAVIGSTPPRAAWIMVSIQACAACGVRTDADFDLRRPVTGSTQRTRARYGSRRPARCSTSADNGTPMGNGSGGLIMRSLEGRSADSVASVARRGSCTGSLAQTAA